MTAEYIVGLVPIIFMGVILIVGGIDALYQRHYDRKYNIVRWEPGSNNRH